MPHCPLCGINTRAPVLAEANWLPLNVRDRLAGGNSNGHGMQGACPACVQQALLRTLLDHGDAALHNGIQAAWPLDAEAAFGALPTPLRLHADPRFTGRGVTLALIDSGFYPHPDLVLPENRIRIWVDAGQDPVHVRHFEQRTVPEWPGWSDRHDGRWHGLMTSTVAAGNGWLSRGLYRGLASDADLVLIRVRNAQGRIGNTEIARALNWVAENGPALGVRVVNLSVAGAPEPSGARDGIDEAVDRLVKGGMTVIAAAGNDGQRRLVPPATSPAALTIGGLDDQNTFDHAEVMLWHSNYGQALNGAFKPELVAPSMWVVAPLLPDTAIAAEASTLFARRARGDRAIEGRISELKLVTPHYQHVDGTSFAAPLVASVVACMLEANPRLTPSLVRHVLVTTAHVVPGAPRERQGAGAVEAGAAIARALGEGHGPHIADQTGPHVSPHGIDYFLHEHDAWAVRVLGSWDGWREPGVTAVQEEPGYWHARQTLLPPGRHAYKFLVNEARWLDDPGNPHKIPDEHGGLNSVVIVPPEWPL